VNTILLGVSATFAIAAVVIAVVFLRPAEEKTAVGTIAAISDRAASTYVQQKPGAQRGFRTPTEIPIAAATVLTIQIDGLTDPVTYPVNTLAGREFQVGQRVTVKYQERGLKHLWHKIYVLDATPID